MLLLLDQFFSAGAVLLRIDSTSAAIAPAAFNGTSCSSTGDMHTSVTYLELLFCLCCRYNGEAVGSIGRLF
jgi:hypothetical protein